MQAYSDSAEIAEKRCLLMEESCSVLGKRQVQRCAAMGGFRTSQVEPGPAWWHLLCGAEQLIQLLDVAKHPG